MISCCYKLAAADKFLYNTMMNDEYKSKSQRKREADAFKELAGELVALSLEKLNRLPLIEPLKKAILDTKKLKSFGAIRRQLLWVSKLIRETNGEELQSAYRELQLEDSTQTAHFHQLEQWRQRLIEDEKALTEFIEQYPDIDIPHLRQLIKKTKNELLQQKNLGASRALFRYIRSIIA